MTAIEKDHRSNAYSTVFKEKGWTNQIAEVASSFVER